MTGQTDSRAKEIKRRARKYRRKRENRSLVTLASLAVILMTGIIALIAETGGGTVSTDGGYGSLVLRSGAGLYVVVGVAAFTAGMALTLVCVRLSGTGKARNRKTITAETSADAQGKGKS